jgi:hypothetical protein
MSTYKDGRIECTETELHIRGYYFPWGTKTIPFRAIRSMERFSMTALRGKGRIWGSGDLRHWANLDPGRPRKEAGFFLDLGRRIIPFVTPDNPDEFERVVREHIDHQSTS